MAQINGSGGGNRLNEEELIAIYEKLRAAEKNRSNDYPFSDWTMDVDVDWTALERRVLRPTLPERVRDFCVAIKPRLAPVWVVGPVIGILATFFWLRTVPVEMSQNFAMHVVAGAALMVLMFVWAAVAIQAMKFDLSRMISGFLTVTCLISTSVMAMAIAPQRGFLHLIEEPAWRARYSVTMIRPRERAADDWTRLAEIQIRRANFPEAQQALTRVKMLDDVPEYERARADVLWGYIDARTTWQELLAASQSQHHADAIARVDEAIRNVTGASRTLGSDPQALLSYLYLARAAATEDEAERAKWGEKAFRCSLHALDAAHAVFAKDGSTAARGGYLGIH